MFKMKLSLIFSLCVIGTTFALNNNENLFRLNAGLHPDVGLNISQLLERNGYPFESYSVVTEDGYILGLHRVPHGVKNTEGPREPILLVHGLFCQSIDWLNNEPNNSLGLLLADRGYDVWLLNTRGNTHSRRHLTLDPDVNKTQFWDFSFNELGYYDYPAAIDFILEKTKVDKISVIAHSQGTASFFVMVSEKPEYNDKVKLFSALAPIAFMKNNNDALAQKLAKNIKKIELAAKVAGIHELVPHSKILATAVKDCYEGSKLEEFCKNMYFNYFGDDTEEFDLRLMPVHLSNTPSGSSFKQIIHFLQAIKHGAFRHYDYGKIKNMKKYNQATAPDYKIENIRVPVALHYGACDNEADEKDVQLLASKLQNVHRIRRVPWDKFVHVDFIWAKHAKSLLYDQILEDVAQFK